MPFRKKSLSGLTERLDVRIAPGEKAEIRAIAKAAGLAVSELVRLRVLGRPVVGRTDATTIRELRRLGGLLKMVHLDSGGAYSEQTGAALGELRAAIGRVAGGERLESSVWNHERGAPDAPRSYLAVQSSMAAPIARRPTGREVVPAASPG